MLFDLINYYEKDNRFISYPDYTGKVSFSGEEALKESLDWSLHGLYITRTNIQRMYPYDECVRFEEMIIRRDCIICVRVR